MWKEKLVEDGESRLCLSLFVCVYERLECRFWLGHGYFIMLYCECVRSRPLFSFHGKMKMCVIDLCWSVCRVSCVCMYCDRTCRLEIDFYFESFFVVRRLSCVDVRRSRLMKDER